MDLRHLIGIALATGVSTLSADVASLAVSTNFAFSVDTCGGTAIVKSLDAVSLPYGVAQKVTATEEDAATTSTLVESAEGMGEYAWTPSAGGYWTLTNSVEGVAKFLVRYSLFPESHGAGTADDPARIVDDDEIPELIDAGSVSYGYVFSLGGEAKMGALDLPSGWALQGVASGTYRIVAASGDMLYEGAGMPFAVDSLRPGPDRTWYRRKLAEVAYTGDNWIGVPSAESTLTVVTPSDAASAEPLSGTGTYSFCPMEKGVYTLTLATASTNLVGKVSVIPLTFTIGFR